METFTKATAHLGRPRNPEHYLLERELLRLAPEAAHIVAYEEGMTTEDHAVARIVWMKPAPAEPTASRSAPGEKFVTQPC